MGIAGTARSLKVGQNDNNKIIPGDSIILTTAIDPSMRVSAIYEDSKSRVWAATTRGLFAYDLNKKDFVVRLPRVKTGSAIIEDEYKTYGLPAKTLQYTNFRTTTSINTPATRFPATSRQSAPTTAATSGSAPTTVC